MRCAAQQGKSRVDSDTDAIIGKILMVLPECDNNLEIKMDIGKKQQVGALLAFEEIPMRFLATRTLIGSSFGNSSDFFYQL
jgi:hypothetical protein